MTVELIGVVALIFGVVSLFRDPRFIVYVFFCFTLLGAAAALILDSLGGTNISPAHILLGFLTFKIFSDRELFKNVKAGVAFGSPGFWLLMTVIYSIFTAFFMPRIFAGQFYIFAVRAQDSHGVLLTPSISNVTQSIYFVGDFICFIALYGYASASNGKKVLGQAALVCAILNLIFAALDLLTYFTNTSELLSFIRNANYAMLNDSEVAGFKRIVGSFTEASSFSFTTLGYFAFTSKLWLLGIRPRLTLILASLSLGALIFSTSTTAYVGLAAFLLFSYLQMLIYSIRRPLTSQMVFFIVGAPIVLAIIVLAIALNDTYSSYVQGLLDTMVLNKMSTDSGIERSAWNRQALQNFFDTFGFGVGNGTVRASSFPVAVLAGLGFIGAAIFAMFFIGVFKRQVRGYSDPIEYAYQEASKSSCVAWLIAATTSGALIDLGLPFFVFAALACAGGQSPRTEIRKRNSENRDLLSSYSHAYGSIPRRE
jgi:hypothetical protein